MATFEDKVIAILADTQRPEEGPRKQAEVDLALAAQQPTYSLCLANIAAHSAVPRPTRQQALLVLKNYINKRWLSCDDKGESQEPVPDEVKAQLRPVVLDLALNCQEHLVQTSACYVVSKIAGFDFPDLWPELLPTLLNIIPNSTDEQLYGALKMIAEIVVDGVGDDGFFASAVEIVKALHGVALNADRKPFLRGLAVAAFCGCFDILEIVKGKHKKESRFFAEEALKGWLPLFEHVMASPIPRSSDDTAQELEAWKGPVSFKIHVVRCLIRIKSVFPKQLLPSMSKFFNLTWQELNQLMPFFNSIYIDSSMKGALDETDNMPCSINSLVLEELDFLNQCLRTPVMQKELLQTLEAHGGAVSTPWVLELMKVAVNYAQVTAEQATLWEIDRSLFIAEEAALSSGYIPRNASGDLLIKLGEWMDHALLDGLFAYTKTLVEGPNVNWQKFEAALYLVSMVVGDFHDCKKEMSPKMVDDYMKLVKYAFQDDNNPLLRARGYLLAGLIANGRPEQEVLLGLAIKGLSDEPSELVQAACVKALESFLRTGTVSKEHQLPIINNLSKWMSAQDSSEMEDADDLVVAIAETLQAAIALHPPAVITPGNDMLESFLSLSRFAGRNFQVEIVLEETVENLVETLQDPPYYMELCNRLLPIIARMIAISNASEEDSMAVVGIEFLNILTERGVEPLPPGFVAGAMPVAVKVLMTAESPDLLRPASSAVTYMLRHDHAQVFSWTDPASNVSGLDACLRVVDRLLSPAVEEAAATLVGGLAAELVDQAGHQRLGPYMAQLLEAVAGRLKTATQPEFIQSLSLVFGRLSLVGARDVVQFLSQINLGGQNGLEMVLSKWLENSPNFAGYDEIRQNVIALSKLYALNDPRIAQIKVNGDLIMPAQTGRIMTRSQTRKQPHQYTIIPAPLKILKLLMSELFSAAGLDDAAAEASEPGNQALFDIEDPDDDDGGEDWEDEPAIVKLRAQVAGLEESDDESRRRRDDETHQYLAEFFIKAARENVAEFQNWYPHFSDDEKAKLNYIANQQQQ